jgi:hypothetical protein
LTAAAATPAQSSELDVEVAKEFASVAKEFGSVAKEFGEIRASIERAKLWMGVTGAGLILSVWGAALTLAQCLRP